MASWGGFFGSQGCYVIAEAAIEIHFWIPEQKVLKAPMEKEQAVHPAGLGYPDRILKPHFYVVSFKTFCKFQEIYFLIIFSSLLGGQARREWSRYQI